MSEQPSFPVPSGDETTNRFVITFNDGATGEGIAALQERAGIAFLPSAADFPESAAPVEVLAAAGGAVFPKLGLAVVTLDDETLGNIAATAGRDAAILDIEPERIFYAIGSGLSHEYLRGYRDAVDHLFEQAGRGAAEEDGRAAAIFFDDALSTWGLKATRVVDSAQTGRGIRVAVLDTGMDLKHPDFAGRAITAQSFIAGEAVQDGNGHGTHCVGTACGRKDRNGRRYGVAGDADIYVGKVLSDAGSGSTLGILAGMEWAIANGCQVISMSLGNTVPTPSTAYERAGQRALQNDCLIIAAAGNHHPLGTVGQPANSLSILAVAALNNQLGLASFSCRAGTAPGANIDIAGPGVTVYSSVPLPTRYASFNGTSMATPHVSGIAALWASATGARGSRLAQLLRSKVLRLPLLPGEVGAGLVQAPIP